MFCPKCGTQNPDGAAFCGGCGAPMAASQPVTASPVAAQAPAPVTTGFPSTPTGIPSMAADGTVAAAAHNTGRKLGIAAAIAVVVIAAILLFVFVFNNKPTYVVQSYIQSETSGGETSISYALAEDGEITSVTSSYAGSSYTTEYRSLGDGITIPQDRTGKYETDANGDIVSVVSGSVTVTYTYYRPGIIKSVTTAYSSERTNVVTYDEDGWPTADEMTNGSETTKIRFEREQPFGSKTVTLKVIDESDSSNNLTSEVLLDEHGNIAEVSVFDEDGKVTSTTTYNYKKIDKPAKFVAATARLKY